MADTIKEAITLCGALAFHPMVKIAITHVAAEVLTEDVDTPSHETRSQWAIKVFQRSQAETEKACILLAYATGVTIHVEDEALLSAVRSNVNVLSGVYKVRPRDPAVVVTQPEIVKKKSFLRRLLRGRNV